MAELTGLRKSNERRESLFTITLSRKGKEKRCSFVHLAFRPYPPAVAVNEALHDSKTNTGTFEVTLTVQSFKYIE